MTRQKTMLVELQMYWRVMHEANEWRRTLPFSIVVEEAREELAILREYSDWPLLRHQIATDVNRLRDAQLERAEALR